MNLKNLVAISCLVLVVASHVRATGQEKNTRSKKVVRLGAVAHTSSVTVFRNLTTYLNRKGYPCDFVLYSNYDALVDALVRGEIDIAWSSPLTHAKFHIRNNCASKTLAMRDVDVNLRLTLVVRSGANVKSPADLAGKRLILGSRWNQSGELLPVHFLKKNGLDLKAVKIVSLHNDRDAKGNPANRPAHVLRALGQGRGDAAVVPVEVWRRASDFRKMHPNVKAVWRSPAFNHCVFSASQQFDAKLGSRFTRLLTTMDAKNPLVAEINRLEHAKKWLPGDAKGFVPLIEALQDKEKKPSKKPTQQSKRFKPIKNGVNSIQNRRYALRAAGWN